jgi:hypothetical protein
VQEVTCPPIEDGVVFLWLQVDVVISPTKTAGIGTKSFSYPLTMGDINLVQLLQITRPKVMSCAELAALIMHTHWM